MRVLVTGIAGFLGSHIAEGLLAEGHGVVGIDNFETGRPENVPGDAGFFAGYDICEEAPLSELFQSKPDVVIHCAASYKDPDDWRGDIETNVLGTVAVVEQAKRCGARLIYLQTALCYGHRPQSGLLLLTTPLDPDNSYAISKTAGESFIRHSGLDHVIFRLANMYGPRNITGPIPTFYRRIKAGERCLIAPTRRDYVYVDDFVPLVLRAVNGEGSGIYHVASGRDYAIRDVFDAVAGAIGDPVRYELVPAIEGDAPSILLDAAVTEIEFGWKATTPLGAGIETAVAWYDEHGVTETYSHIPTAGAT